MKSWFGRTGKKRKVAENIPQGNSELSDSMKQEVERIAQEIFALNANVLQAFSVKSFFEKMNDQKASNKINNTKIKYIDPIIVHTNNMTAYVQNDILSHNTTKKMMEALRKWMLVANSCFEKGDANGMVSIVSALQNDNIYLLSKIETAEGLIQGVPVEERNKYNDLLKYASARGQQQRREKEWFIPAVPDFMHKIALNLEAEHKIESSNLTEYVKEYILKQPDIERKAIAAKAWICVMNSCYYYGYLNALVAIYNAFKSEELLHFSNGNELLKHLTKDENIRFHALMEEGRVQAVKPPSALDVNFIINKLNNVLNTEDNNNEFSSLVSVPYSAKPLMYPPLKAIEDSLNSYKEKVASRIQDGFDFKQNKYLSFEDTASFREILNKRSIAVRPLQINTSRGSRIPSYPSINDEVIKIIEPDVSANSAVLAFGSLSSGSGPEEPIPIQSDVSSPSTTRASSSWLKPSRILHVHPGMVSSPTPSPFSSSGAANSNADRNHAIDEISSSWETAGSDRGLMSSPPMPNPISSPEAVQDAASSASTTDVESDDESKEERYDAEDAVSEKYRDAALSLSEADEMAREIYAALIKDQATSPGGIASEAMDEVDACLASLPRRKEVLVLQNVLRQINSVQTTALLKTGGDSAQNFITHTGDNISISLDKASCYEERISAAGDFRSDIAKLSSKIDRKVIFSQLFSAEQLDINEFCNDNLIYSCQTEDEFKEFVESKFSPPNPTLADSLAKSLFAAYQSNCLHNTSQGDMIPCKDYLLLADRQIQSYLAQNGSRKPLYIKPSLDPNMVKAYILICKAKHLKYVNQSEKFVGYTPNDNLIDAIHSLTLGDNKLLQPVLKVDISEQIKILQETSPITNKIKKGQKLNDDDLKLIREKLVPPVHSHAVRL